MIEKKDLKVCMFLQRKAALWGHALALELKELGVAQFSAYASPFRSAEFLRAQHDIAYQPLLVDEEIIANFKDEKIDFTFLKDMEEKYGMPNLWHYIFMDRYLIMSKAKTSYEPSYNYHEMLQILQLRLRAIVKMLEETKPDVMIFSSIATMPSLLCYQISKKMGIKTMQVASTRVGKRIGVMEGLEEYTSVLSVFKSIQAGQRERKYEAEALGFLKEFRQEKKAAYTVFQLSHSKFLPKRVYKALVHIIRRTFRHSTTTRKNDYMEEDNVNYFRKRITKKINT